ncbi:MAG: tRNA (N(6)-L-threonylcarbamoyladenosine(37)-C(2))-methylthiotransferase [Nanoarchaeota archaeon]|nr:tRNA (N(6)-L-threonylcarbamoyladenosine(37)-C(2))-methylthiotransferase [Nanoarchaeota archaeon]MBU1945628.1 tRNA (N(6)-L-threonylcarbamoyladenosine(37)-C(2))-methylthiotransferase [Nanoarchaeota archaeon]
MTNIYFQTHGCSTNLSESEVMMGLLRESKFEIVEDPSDADVIVINICTVKGEDTALREIRKLNDNFLGKKLIVAGCITKIILNETRKINDEISFISTHNIKSIVEVVEETLNGNVIEATGRDQYEKINLPKMRKNPVVGIIPILNGCAGYCAYCSVKYVKGKLFSYPMQDIEKEANECLIQGCKELWITSQDNAAYMLERDKLTKLPELIENLSRIDKKFFMRIGMMNPEHLLKVLPQMIEAYKSDKVFKFLHIPVQSGNDEILKLMKRQYTVEDFKLIVNEFRKNIPSISISTDLIVGFPTETEQQFNDSLGLVKEIKPDVLNISKFQARHGTDAVKMKEQVDGVIVKARSKLLTDIFHNISRMNHEQWIGWEGEVLIDEIGKNNTFISRNIDYRQIILSGEFKLGDIVRVRVIDGTTFDLRGERVT